MSFAPDIVVTAADSPRMLLIVETKLRSRDPAREEFQLKSYMLHMRCPIGLFVTPDEIVVYRDTYTAHSEQSVGRVGAFPAPKSWTAFRVPHHGTERSTAAKTDLALRFEENVKSWLEQLGSSQSAESAEFPDDTREALYDYVLPALSEGVVRGGGPREERLEAG